MASKKKGSKAAAAEPPSGVYANPDGPDRNDVHWSGGGPYFWVQRQDQGSTGRWGRWKDLATTRNTIIYSDYSTPIVNTTTRYRVGSSDAQSTRPTDSQWSDPSDPVTNPG